MQKHNYPICNKSVSDLTRTYFLERIRCDFVLKLHAVTSNLKKAAERMTKNSSIRIFY